jgi:hydrogenase small subunit
MPTQTQLGEMLREQGISRRSLLKYCAAMASVMGLAPALVPTLAKALEEARRPSLIWLSFQECTGCTESLTRSHAPTLEGLIFDAISLDYHETLQAASGRRAEEARKRAMKENYGHYLLAVDGSIPLADPGYSVIAGVSNRDTLVEMAKGAAAIIAIGTCAAYGGIPMAQPNPTGAVSVADIIKDRPIVNVPGCPPVPVVMTGVVAHYLTLGKLPELDHLGRPLAFYGVTIHDRCYRRPFYDRGEFADSFDDEGARKGWCLFKLGCKAPVTYNACATTKWNEGTSFPIQSGHGCLGCSEPGFWDQGSFYAPISQDHMVRGLQVPIAAAAGAAIGAGAALLARRRHKASTGHDG